MTKCSFTNILASIAILLAVGACSSKVERPVLKFHDDGTFKIVQFTDTHVIAGNSESFRADSVIREVLDAENPDLVVFTGDQIFGSPAAEGLQRQFSIVSEKGVPFIYTFGNHDREQDMTGGELLSYSQTFLGSLLCTPADTIIGWTYGDVPIISSKNDSTVAVVYIFDSGDYSSKKELGIGGYAWMAKGQIDYYGQRSHVYTKANNDVPLPSVAFYHIPVPEYKEASDTSIMVGTFNEAICSPEINSGLFTEMIECGDIFANFVGHDHDNNFVAMWKGMALCYGQYSGGNTVYNHIGSGARVIELYEGKKELCTWIRMLGGEVKDKVFVRGGSQNQ